MGAFYESYLKLLFPLSRTLFLFCFAPKHFVRIGWVCWDDKNPHLSAYSGKGLFVLTHHGLVVAILCLLHSGIEAGELFFLNVVFIFYFCLLFWEWANKWGRGRERGRWNLKQTSCCQHRARCGAWTHEPWNHDRSRNPKSDA